MDRRKKKSANFSDENFHVFLDWIDFSSKSDRIEIFRPEESKSCAESPPSFVLK